MKKTFVASSVVIGPRGMICAGGREALAAIDSLVYPQSGLFSRVTARLHSLRFRRGFESDSTIHALRQIQFALTFFA